MRISNILPIALAAAPVAVSAAGTLGLALGDKNPDGSCKQTSDYEADFDQLKSVTKLVRTYSASDCNTAKNIIPAAKAKGFKVVLGVWPDYDQSFKQDTDALQATVPGNEDVVEAITVGSETLYRGTFTGQQLLDRINKVKAMFPTVKIGTADSWNKFVDGTADPLITGGVEYILTNAFAYWQGQPAEDAHKTYFDDMAQTINHIQKLAGENANKIQIITGETGWPTSKHPLLPFTTVLDKSQACTINSSFSVFTHKGNAVLPAPAPTASPTVRRDSFRFPPTSTVNS
ncbi:CAZyme family GH17 [Paecilomyces variotii]|nr:CAZyme family GH17 [Paecilomyces variotii]